MTESDRMGKLDTDLARRLHRALTAGKEELFRVMEEGSVEVLLTALRNPSLDDNHLLSLLKRRDLPEELLAAIYRRDQDRGNHPIKVALAGNPSTPGRIVLALLPHLHLFELAALTLRPDTTPDQRLAAERAIIQRLPSVPLGNKLTMARRGTASIVTALLREGDSRLTETCLDNPRLPDAAVFQFVSGAGASGETISAVARHPRYKERPNIRLAILKNPKTPAVWFPLFLPRVPAGEVRNLAASRRLTPAQRALVEEELRRRGLR